MQSAAEAAAWQCHPVNAYFLRRFLDLGGYDPIYFPGRIEDLDLGFRCWMAGFRGYYVPESVAFHKGWGTFEPQFGKDFCDALASRNTLIFMWKNTGGARLLWIEYLASFLVPSSEGMIAMSVALDVFGSSGDAR